MSRASHLAELDPLQQQVVVSSGVTPTNALLNSVARARRGISKGRLLDRAIRLLQAASGIIESGRY